MPTLKDTYPLYLNNKAQQPNTDLAVTDKFTGEVAAHARQPRDHRRGDRGGGPRGGADGASPVRRRPSCALRRPLASADSSPMRCASKRASRSRTARARSQG